MLRLGEDDGLSGKSTQAGSTKSVFNCDRPAALGTLNRQAQHPQVRAYTARAFALARRREPTHRRRRAVQI